LFYIDPIVHIKIALGLHWYQDILVDEGEQYISSMFVGGSDGKIVGLLPEEDAVSIYDAGVKAGLVNNRSESDVSKNRVSVLLPEAG
jgi:hypothetical protein